MVTDQIEEPAFIMGPANIGGRAAELWKSGRQVWWLVTEELFRVTSSIKGAVETLNQGRRKNIGVVLHDRWSGFHRGLPPIALCKDKSNSLGTALQMAMMSKEELEQGGFKPSFDPEDDLIFVFKSIDEEIRSQPLTLTLLKNIMMSNACSAQYTKDRSKDDQCEHHRGTRMIVLLTTTMSMPEAIPELKPEIVPLPSYECLKGIAMDTLEPEWDAFKGSSGKDGIERLDDVTFDKVILSLRGMTAADAEEVLALAIVRHECKKYRKVRDLDALLDTIEGEKAKVISKVPGLTYIRKSDIVGEPLPGYEVLTQFLDNRMGISHTVASEHDLTPLRGIALGGAPGGGKTEVAKYIARRLARIGLIWDIGGSKGSLVGQSEDNCRKVILIAREMRALVLCDDVDKGGLAKAKDYSGDGGTGGNMVQMLLTEMSDPTSEAVYVFTFNRVPDMPELLRPGRVDERFYVERPNGPTRLAILQNHVRRVKLAVDDEAALEKLAYDGTTDWTGAELAHVLIRSEAIRALAAGSKVLNVERMTARAKGFIPMVKQRAFTEDIARMEEACSQFEKIGNVAGPVPAKPQVTTTVRSRRGAQV